jgi:dynein heavy chain
LSDICAQVPTVNQNLARSLFNIIDTVTARFYPVPEGKATSEEPPTEEQLNDLIKHIEPIFWFALIWSVGASMDAAGRIKFDKWVCDLL